MAFIRIGYRNAPAPDNEILYRFSVTSAVRQAVTEPRFLLRHLFRRNGQPAVIHIRDGYTGAQRKNLCNWHPNAVCNISMFRYVPDCFSCIPAHTSDSIMTMLFPYPAKPVYHARPALLSVFPHFSSGFISFSEVFLRSTARISRLNRDLHDTPPCLCALFLQARQTLFRQT